MEWLHRDDGCARVKRDAQRIAQRRGRGTRTCSVLRDLAAGKLSRVAKHFRRIDTIQRLIETQVDILETMTPHEFNAFRDNLNPASGFQSVQFREIEFMSGLRNTEVLEHMSMTDA